MPRNSFWLWNFLTKSFSPKSQFDQKVAFLMLIQASAVKSEEKNSSFWINKIWFKMSLNLVTTVNKKKKLYVCYTGKKILV